MRGDGLDRNGSERDFYLRLFEALIRQLDRMQAEVGGREIRFDIPFLEQFDAETVSALRRVMFDDDELQDFVAAHDREWRRSDV